MFEARHQRLINREEFLNLIDQVKISPVTRNLSDVISRQSDALNNSGATTDFGSTTTTIGNTLSASAGTMNGNTSTVIFTGTGNLAGGNNKTFYNFIIPLHLIKT